MADTLHSTEKLSVAALISVILRRKIGRTIDTKWLIENEVYAKSIIALSREQGLADLNEYANHFEMIMFGTLSNKRPVLEKQHYTKNNISDSKKSLMSSIENESEKIGEMVDPKMYIGGLR
jgi:hypothetical protein